MYVIDEKMKAILKRVGWTMAEVALVCIGGATQMEEVNWQILASMVILAGIVCFLKCIVFGVPEIQPAEEANEADVLAESKDVKEYQNTEDYDDLHVDDDGDDDDEMEQKN